jgi:hypothetical protein
MEDRTKELTATRDALLELMRNDGVDAQPLEIQMKPGGRAPRPDGRLGIAFIHEGKRYAIPITWLGTSGGPQAENPLVKAADQ